MRVLLVIAVLLGVACERNDQDNAYRPGGSFVKQLDARGRRHVLRDANGDALAKVRVRPHGLKVYGADMSPLGEVSWAKEEITVQRRGALPVTLTHPAKGVVELSGSFRIESVERGWVVFDSDAKRLGYFEYMDDGRFALRNDYSSAPRIYAKTDEGETRSASGAVTLSTTPPYSAVVMLPFALGGLDALDSVALGVWLRSQTKADEG